ncbi:MAG TPA: hypothetical protein PKA64_01515 [Myxococcota bacterium]|nr:hypothetical protein [Myxococcota bacterium]
MSVRLPLSYLLGLCLIVLALAGTALMQADSIASLRYRVDLLEEEHMRILGACE